MVPRLCPKVLAFAALVSSGPVFAQEGAPHAAADMLAIAVPAPEFVAKAAIVMVQGEIIQPELDAFLLPGGVSPESPKGPIRHFVDRTTQPVVRLTRQSGEWLISNANAATPLSIRPSRTIALPSAWNFSGEKTQVTTPTARVMPVNTTLAPVTLKVRR